MDRKQFARFIKLLKEANERGEDVDAIMKAYEHENAYIYNDGVFKKIFASEENIALTTDLVNASLDLFGCDCISHARIVNPFVPGETGKSSVEPDIMLVNEAAGSMERRKREGMLYFDLQTMTIVEVKKFLEHADAYAGDNSRLAQWLRAIDTLNREADFSEFSQDPVFRVLQNAVKMCNFSARYLMTVDMSDVDRAMEKYEAALEKSKEIAKGLLRDGVPLDVIVRNTNLPEKVILSL